MDIDMRAVGPLPACLEYVDGGIRLTGHRVSLLDVADNVAAGTPLARLAEMFPSVPWRQLAEVIQFCRDYPETVRRYREAWLAAFDAVMRDRVGRAPSLAELKARKAKREGDVAMCFEGFGKAADPLIRAIGEAKDRADARVAIPASCPACSSREIVRRMGDPTWWACRDCELEWDLRNSPPFPESVPAPVPPEDRGTSLWVWRDEDGWWSFWKLPRAVERVEVSVPIGWRLAPDPEHGVMLGNVWGDRLTAVAALHHAERGEGGFRVRRREKTG